MSCEPNVVAEFISALIRLFWISNLEIGICLTFVIAANFSHVIASEANAERGNPVV